MIIQWEVLEQIKKLKNGSQDIIFCDPPYNLWSEWTIWSDWKLKIKWKAKDFMSKWEWLDENFLEDFFFESERVLKPWWRVFMFWLDRQLLPFEYYALKNWLKKQQSLYWFFVSNFPKWTDLWKQLNKKLWKYKDKEIVWSKKWEINITKPSTELAKQFDWYKYWIAALKQTLETVLVFQKDYKWTIAENIIAWKVEMKDIENNEKNSIPTYNTDNNRIKSDDPKIRKREINFNKYKGIFWFKKKFKYKKYLSNETSYNLWWRYPSQLYIKDSEETKNIIDNQTWIKKSTARNIWKNEKKIKWENAINYKMDRKLGWFNDIWWTKILIKCDCDYDKWNYDILIYDTKVQKKERNIWLENEEDKLKWENLWQLWWLTWSWNPRNYITKNNHPTLKPISLIYNIARLLKLPEWYKQNIFIPFAWTGSEYIWFLMAWFNENNIIGVELNEDYVNIAEKRIEAFKEWKLDYIKEKADKQFPNK